MSLGINVLKTRNFVPEEVKHIEKLLAVLLNVIAYWEKYKSI